MSPGGGCLGLGGGIEGPLGLGGHGRLSGVSGSWGGEEGASSQGRGEVGVSLEGPWGEGGYEGEQGPGYLVWVGVMCVSMHVCVYRFTGGVRSGM